jgi:hypothetical protein
MSDQDSTTPGSSVPGGETASPAPPALRVGDTLIFKYEGNLRAQVLGFEDVEGVMWLQCRASLDFLVPPCQIVGVEPKE